MLNEMNPFDIEFNNTQLMLSPLRRVSYSFVSGRSPRNSTPTPFICITINQSPTNYVHVKQLKMNFMALIKEKKRIQIKKKVYN